MPGSVGETGSALFRPLANATAAGLREVARGGSGNEPDTTVDVGDDGAYAPDGPLLRFEHASRPGLLSAKNAEGASDGLRDEYSDDDYDNDDDADDALQDIGEWAASPEGARANLTARVQQRTNANTHHASAAAAIHRLDRAEDRRREHVARDKLDRATVEQVLDPRTRMILFRMLSKGTLASIDGCVSTGKEANVYYGVDSCARDVAVKVFKTSILTFKDRERYVSGEHRFGRLGYNRQSNRKMVYQWTEKEYRNLVRLHDAGLQVPQPLIMKPPILVMTFFGRGGWPAPRLKDAGLDSERLSAAYRQTCLQMRYMFVRARLVHGDLSEYNLLYHRGQVVIIDVSQSVEGDHPMALDFLRRDCGNINEFFRRGNVPSVLGLRELFDFVTSPQTEQESDEDMARNLDNALDRARARTDEEDRALAAEDVIFEKSFIPRCLEDVVNTRGDARPLADHGLDAVLYNRISKLAAPDAVCDDQAESGSETAASDEDSGGGGGGGSSSTKNDKGHSAGKDADTSDDSDSEAENDDDTDSARDDRTDSTETPGDDERAARKAHKKAVKAANRERRETKTPKHVKKRREALAKRRRHVKTKK